MEHLLAAEKYVKDLEAKIAQLEKENAAKDLEIKRLSSGVGSSSSSSSSVPTEKAAPAGVSSPQKSSAPPSSEEPPTKKAADAPASYKRIAIPTARQPTPQEKDTLTCYDDDSALGKKAPKMAHLKWFNGEPVEFGQGKPVVITFFSKLNKGDFGTLSLMSEYAAQFGDKVTFAGVSRDGEEEDVAKFAGKYHGKHFDELAAPDGSPGLTVYINFPLAFDDADGFNTQLKQAMKKGTIGVGMTILVDGEGHIRWIEQFVRGFNPMGQLMTQIQNLLDGKPLLSNGNGPEVQTIEESVDVPDDVDPFAKTGKY